ncbi:carbohydrate esterase family 9 protein [Apiospora phragmitis]|uniref:Carbohydrate esterase family 9 protein n=1 Tax=Apiospora phragmitis TaxID=2905665 RepID=A0ABR1WW48_9PEZI
MGFKKEGDLMLPPYSAAGPVPPPPPRWRRRRPARLTRVLKILGLACLGFIVYAQWRQISGSSPTESAARRNPSRLSMDKLHADLQTCAKLHKKPQDPIGLGRERNARYVDGHKPTLIKNATVWVGEPAKGTSAEGAWAGKGYAWINADVYMEYGLIKKVEKDISPRSLASDTLVWDAQGRQLTTGIIDMHSHAGVDSLPELVGNDDTNEMSADITPYVRSIDGLQPQDHQIQVIKSGGVTTSLVLPGSGNNIGGEAYPIKHAVGQPDGRAEIAVADMLADPDRSWRYMKMACGENAKRVYGKVGEHGPVSRLGESWEFRRAFETAATLNRAQDDWCAQAEAVGVEKMDAYLPQDLKWESLGAALRGQVHINTHCYTVPDLEAFVDHTNEFNFSIRAFHHAHQTYLVPEILKRAWGPTPPASALFADNMWYKAEAYVGSEYAGKKLWEAGLTPIYVSDNPVLNAQHVVFEAAKAFGYGLPYAVALASVTTAPAERLGLAERLGKVKPGFDADVVVWDSDPLSVGAAPVQVWIDGTAQFDDPVELEKPLRGPIDPKTTFDMPTEEPTDVVADVVFTGVTTSYLPGLEGSARGSSTGSNNLTVAVSCGKVVCVGASCPSKVVGAATRRIHLKDGYLTKPFTAFGSLLGLNAIDAEDSTDNGHSTSQFSRGVDGLRLGTKKLRYAHRYGVTRAISAPAFASAGTHFGTSVGFRTDAGHVLENGVVFAEDVAVHYTLQEEAAKSGGDGTVSGAVGALRRKLLKAVGDVKDANNETTADAFSEEAYLRRVVRGEVPLAITVHSADGIASALKLKAQVEEVGQSNLTVVILGGAESHLVADELAAARVGVVLSPLQSYRTSWDQRRALTGAPLTNGTAVDALVRAGVVVAIGLEEDWLVRDMGLLAGIVWRNGGGAAGRGEALGLVGGMCIRCWGWTARARTRIRRRVIPRRRREEEEEEEENKEFLVFEGSPLEIGGEDSGGGWSWEGGTVCISAVSKYVALVCIAI